MSKILAIHDGDPIRKKTLFPKQLTIGQEETRAVKDVMLSKSLSKYRGNWIPEFWGGEKVQQFEKDFSGMFNTKALAVNSCTSALQIACCAIGLKPGDEVIVTPWSMSCSATAPLVCGATPVFADIEYDKFCLDPESILKKITNKTRAIIVVSLFGQPYDSKINAIAKENNLIIIEDAAQSIGSYTKIDKFCSELDEIKYSGTLGDIGCFSFTQGKHLTCGEGGIICTNNEVFYENASLIRNHAEAVISARYDKEISGNYFTHLNLFGFNMRMTELHAAIMIEQLKKLEDYVAMRQKNAEELYKLICDAIPYINRPPVRNDCTHSYYVQPFLYDNEKAPVHREEFIKAVNAELCGEEGRPDKPMIGCGYIKPLYLMPFFNTQKHWALRTEGFNPYVEGACPTCEKLWKDDFFLSMYHALPLKLDDKTDIQAAFLKVHHNI